MKKILFALALLCCGIGASCQNFKMDGNNYSSTKQSKEKAEPVKTPYTYTDTKGNKYVIYMSSTGSCFIYKTNKEGKQYKQYLGKEISADICKRLGVEYKPRK